MAKKTCIWLCLLMMISNIAYALPFSIMPKSGTQLPATVPSGNAATAYYTVTNNTNVQRNNNYVKYLPPNVSQVTTSGTYADTCGSTFNLMPGGSCTLQLAVTGEVDANDKDPRNHLFVCFPGGITCAGTNFPLSVTVTDPIYAYISNNSNSTLSYCSFNANGGFNNCLTTGSNISNPSGIAINKAGTYLYVTNENGSLQNTISYCAINANGSLNACETTRTGLLSPADITFNPAGTIAYIANETDGIVYCPVNSNGSLDTCVQTGTSFSNPAGIRINATNTFAYIANFGNNTVTYCAINTDGSLGVCSVTSSATFNGPNSVEINPAGNMIYVANKNSNTVSYCPLNSDGSVGTCAVTGSGLSTPFSIAFNAGGTLAYVVNSGNNTVSYCNVNSDGSFGACNTTGSGLSGPRGIVFGN